MLTVTKSSALIPFTYTMNKKIDFAGSSTSAPRGSPYFFVIHTFCNNTLVDSTLNGGYRIRYTFIDV